MCLDDSNERKKVTVATEVNQYTDSSTKQNLDESESFYLKSL
jgi:hypothetical protein